MTDTRHMTEEQFRDHLRALRNARLAPDSVPLKKLGSNEGAYRLVDATLVSIHEAIGKQTTVHFGQRAYSFLTGIPHVAQPHRRLFLGLRSMMEVEDSWLKGYRTHHAEDCVEWRLFDGSCRFGINLLLFQNILTPATNDPFNRDNATKALLMSLAGLRHVTHSDMRYAPPFYACNLGLQVMRVIVENPSARTIYEAYWEETRAQLALPETDIGPTFVAPQVADDYDRVTIQVVALFAGKQHFGFTVEVP